MIVALLFWLIVIAVVLSAVALPALLRLRRENRADRLRVELERLQLATGHLLRECALSSQDERIAEALHNFERTPLARTRRLQRNYRPEHRAESTIAVSRQAVEVIEGWMPRIEDDRLYALCEQYQRVLLEAISQFLPGSLWLNFLPAPWRIRLSGQTDRLMPIYQWYRYRRAA